MVPRACNPRYLKIVFDSAEILTFKHFRACSACDEIVSAYAQHTHAIIFENTKKYQIKMQILTINNRNFQKPSRNLSNRTKLKIKIKTILDSSSKKFDSAYVRSPRKCSNIEILAKIEGKEAKFFFENLRRAFKDLT
jgi:hypothetical protein